MQIRNAMPEDLKLVARLCFLMYRSTTVLELLETLEGALRNFNSVFLLAMEGDEAVGLCCLGIRDPEIGEEILGQARFPQKIAVLNGVYVLKPYRRRGIARQLLQQAQSWAKTRGCGAFLSSCEQPNTGGMQFYQQCGFLQKSCLLSKVL